MARKNRSCALLALLLLGGTACRKPEVRTSPLAPSIRPLARIGHSIQAGAFARAENAVRFTEVLQDAGLEATYFRAADGLYKVRFGDFPTRETARARAEALVAAGTLDTYFLVAPERPSQAHPELDGLRQRLSRTACDFLGVPYLWGGTDADSGFDCSGFTMTVYRLNGLKLPRASQAQWREGAPVSREDLRPGDLVFFDTRGRGSISHVGLYLGEGRFIHAPSRGKQIQVEPLDAPYYAARFRGARTYVG